MKRYRRLMGLAMLVVAGMMLLGWPEPAAAYVGPGAGLTIIGAALAFIAAVVFGVFGFLWYPLKRLYRALFRREAGRPDVTDA